MNGVINVLKPSGMTSFDVVGYLRSVLKIKKIGHTGTLDPAAVGVLPICIGKATKAIEYLIDKNKVYRTEMILGVSTDTQDATGNVIKRSVVNVSCEDIEKALESFIGKYDQIPPMYSAVKVNGKKLYQLARKGISVERQSRQVEVFFIDVLHIKGNTVIFDVGCSKGTYIRTLCSDVGDILGCGGHMSFLLRKESGVFGLDTALTLEEIDMLASKGCLHEKIIPIEELFKDYNKITLNKLDTKRFMNGVKIVIDSKYIGICQSLKVYGDDGAFIALGETYENKDNDVVLKLKKFFS
ncbi:UNVERIFIED_CONTAM: tRNA pseudouridine55 synthase [Acetivibrio alkalicellulosi]